MKILKSFVFTCTLASLVTFGQQKPLHEFVNPFIGTGGHGHTYPGASVPFGMVQLSPDTRLDGWDGCGGYHYSDSILYGFSHTHLSGTGVSDYGDLLFMPFIGPANWESGYPGEDGYGTPFSHEQEHAHAGYYRVVLPTDNIQVELTTTKRCGIHRYHFEKWEHKKILIDLSHRDKVLDTDLIFLNDSTIVGKRISSAWAAEQHFYFAIQFSEAVKDRILKKDSNGKPKQIALQFGHLKQDLIVKVGVSAVDINGALGNLKKEAKHWDFETYKDQAQLSWDKELSAIMVESDSKDDKVIFYTALYHSYLNPNLFSDVDGRYRGMDLELHSAKNHHQYTVFSLWDTFRATHPLFTLTQQKKTLDFIQTFLTQYKDGGILPIWELSANYTGCMIGYHAIPVIVDAYMKGIRDFDTNLALEAMMHSANQNHLGLAAYKSHGFISSEDESESVSKTLEYAYDDWCIAIFANAIGKKEIATEFFNRAQSYKNIYHPKSKFMQPRFNGGWKSDFEPNEVTFDYTEANSWQYSLFVPQDIKGLINLLGGPDSLEIWLDNLFTAPQETTGRHQVDITGLIGQYAHGNEPSHHMAYLYNYTKAPWKTQFYVNQISNELYNNTPDGLSGNEDCGQMSSWYVLSSLGIYSLTPGTNYYALGAPQYDRAEMRFENNQRMIITRERQNDAANFVQEVYLNNKLLDRNFIYHEELTNGGTLKFVMGTEKRTSFFAANPITSINPASFLRAPIISDAKIAFTKKRQLYFEPISDSCEIRYTTDGTVPTAKSKKYKNKGIKLKETTYINAAVFSTHFQSKPVKAYFVAENNDWQIKLNSEYHKQYTGGGERALIDQVSGNADFRTGSWQGYFNQDVDVEIDMLKVQEISEISIHCLQDAKSWIWMPSEVIFKISDDGINWFTLGTVSNTIAKDQMGSITSSFSLSKSTKTRYVKIIAKNPGTCPAWHPGSGNPSYIFADEITIR
jgi:predicted alpha-1,2-mannosidase